MCFGGASRRVATAGWRPSHGRQRPAVRATAAPWAGVIGASCRQSRRWSSVWRSGDRRNGRVGYGQLTLKGLIMREENHSAESDKTLAAVCGLYCEACTLFIATKEDPARLKELAARFRLSEEAVKCYGCRSTKRWPYCQTCKMFSCAAERGLECCGGCRDYPCSDLKQFQSERPHRIELWDDLAQITAIGYEHWLRGIRENYACPQCRTINSAYDPQCRKCGEEPSCNYVARHKQEIERFFKSP
jgi:uncharacterized protein YutD